MRLRLQGLCKNFAVVTITLGLDSSYYDKYHEKLMFESSRTDDCVENLI